MYTSTYFHIFPQINHRKGHITHVQSFRVCLQKPAWTFGLSCGKSAKKVGIGLYSLSFSIGSIYGDVFCFILNTRRSDIRFFARKIVQPCRGGVPGTGMLRKEDETKKTIEFLPKETPLPVTDRGWSRRILATSASRMT